MPGQKPGPTFQTCSPDTELRGGQERSGHRHPLPAGPSSCPGGPSHGRAVPTLKASPAAPWGCPFQSPGHPRWRWRVLGKLEAGWARPGPNQRVRGVTRPRQLGNHRPARSTATKQRGEGGTCPGPWRRRKQRQSWAERAEQEGEQTQKDTHRQHRPSKHPRRKNIEQDAPGSLKGSLGKWGHQDSPRTHP